LTSAALVIALRMDEHEQQLFWRAHQGQCLQPRQGQTLNVLQGELCFQTQLLGGERRSEEKTYRVKAPSCAPM
jgi:hypothetical protein